MSELSPETVAAVQAQAAEAVEPKQVAKAVTFRDQTFTIPPKPTVDFLYFAEADQSMHALEELLGATQWARLRALRPKAAVDEANAMMTKIAKAYGIDLGN